MRKVEELCAILRLNVTIALSVSAGTFFLFELRRPVPLDLFQQHGPDALNQPNAIRGHGQELLGRINPGFDKYACCPRTEPTFCKRQCPVGLAVSRFTSGRQPIRNEGSVRPRRSPAAVCSRPMRWKVPAQQVTARGLETAVDSKAMVRIARSIGLYNSAYRLAWQHISEQQKRERSDVAQRLHESIERQLKEGASLDVLIASEALSELTK